MITVVLFVHSGYISDIYRRIHRIIFGKLYKFLYYYGIKDKLPGLQNDHIFVNNYVNFLISEARLI